MEKKDISIKNLEIIIQNIKEENRWLKEQAEIHEEHFNKLTLLKKKTDSELKEKIAETDKLEFELNALKNQYSLLQKNLMSITEEKQKEFNKSDSFAPINMPESNIMTSSFDIAGSPTNNNNKYNGNNLHNELKEIEGSMNSLDFFNFSKIKQESEIKLSEERKDEKNLETIKLLERKIEELEHKNEEEKRIMEGKMKEICAEKFKKNNVLLFLNYFFLF